MSIILFGILGAIISALVGMVWYSMKTPMGRVHMKSMGMGDMTPEERMKMMKDTASKMRRYYFGQFILSFLTSAFVAFIMKEQKDYGVSASAVYPEIISIWLCFTVPTIGQALIWGNIDSKLRWKKFFSDIFGNLLIYLGIIFVFSLFI